MEKSKYIIEYYKAFGKVPKLQTFTFEDPMQTAFKLPPERALAWLKQRGKNLKLSTDWNELDADAHNKAFTVAKVMSADILQTIFENVEKAKYEGLTLKQFKDNLLPSLENSGWTGATASRLKVIYDTNMQMAYSQGKYKQQKLIADLYPFWKYSQIERSTKRHDHALLNGKVFRHDDPIWKKIYPPSGFGCKCSVIPIKDNSKLESGSEYLKDFATSNDFGLTPLDSWEADTSKYIDGIRRQLESFLKQEIKNLYDKLFEDEELMKKLSEKATTPSKEDLGHKGIAELQGFTDKPQIKSQSEIDNMNLENYYVCYRGLNGLEFYEQFKTGEYFSGRGIFGSGTYAAIDDIRATAPYTDQKEVMKILFPKDTKIINYKELEKDFWKQEDNYELIACKRLGLRPNEDKLLRDELSRTASKLSLEEREALANKYEDAYEKIKEETKNIRRNSKYLNDIGSYAATLGYDAILVEDRKYLVIMNRSKCIVQNENVELRPFGFSEGINKMISAELSRRLGRIWNFIPNYTDIKPAELFSYSLEISSCKSFGDLPKTIQEAVLKTEKALGIK